MSALADLDGARVLVTGASSGIGAALAPMLAERGATVGIVARRADRLAAVLDRCEAAGAGPRAPAAGASTWPTPTPPRGSRSRRGTRSAGSTPSSTTRLDRCAARCSGSTSRPSTRSCARTTCRRWRMSLAVLPRMLDRDHGVIVNVSSLGGRLGIAHEAAYVASKFALSGWSRGHGDGPVVHRASRSAWSPPAPSTPRSGISRATIRRPTTVRSSRRPRWPRRSAPRSTSDAVRDLRPRPEGRRRVQDQRHRRLPGVGGLVHGRRGAATTEEARS